MLAVSVRRLAPRQLTLIGLGLVLTALFALGLAPPASATHIVTSVTLVGDDGCTIKVEGLGADYSVETNTEAIRGGHVTPDTVERVVDGSDVYFILPPSDEVVRWGVFIFPAASEAQTPLTFFAVDTQCVPAEEVPVEEPAVTNPGRGGEYGASPYAPPFAGTGTPGRTDTPPPGRVIKP